MRVRTFLLAMAAASLCGCAGGPAEKGLDSPLPSQRMRAIATLDERPDERKTIQRLIEQLDHDDPIIRRIAAEHLERRTGQTHGFRYDAPLAERREAVREWVRWYNETLAESNSHTESD